MKLNQIDWEERDRKVVRKETQTKKDGDLYGEKMDLINEKIGMLDDKERLLKDSIRKVN